MRVITLDINKTVISVKNVGDNYALEVNDIVADTGELGQIMQPDGTFITPEPIPVIPPPIQPTNQEIKDNLMVIMNGLTDIYMATLGL